MNFFLASLIFIAPLYIWRFNLFGLPTNFLMVAIGALIIVAVVDITRRGWWGEFGQALAKLPKLLWVGIGLFTLASLMALIVNGFDMSKLGQWIVLVGEPLVIASLSYFYIVKRGGQQTYFKAMLWFVGLSGILAFLQYFWLLTLPMDWWGNPDEPKRAIGPFVHPNNYALFITPVLAYTLPLVYEKLPAMANKLYSAASGFVGLWLLGLLGLVLSLSRGGWLALLAAVGLFVLFRANKKLLLGFLVSIIALAVVVVSTPILRYRVMLPFYGEKSSVARLSLWDTGWKMVKDNPVLGQGLHGFNYGWEKFNTDPNLAHYNFPHNIILNFWVDFGLLGMLAFVLIAVSALWLGWRQRSSPYGLGLILVIVAIVIHGLIDIPYLKNDLALLFWIILAVSAGVIVNKKPVIC